MNLEEMCRLCSAGKPRMKCIFRDYGDQGLAQIITDVLRLELRENDGLPGRICKQCAGILLKMGENIQRFRQNDVLLRRKLLLAPPDVVFMPEYRVETVQIIPAPALKEETDDLDPMLLDFSRNPQKDLLLQSMMDIKQESADGESQGSDFEPDNDASDSSDSGESNEDDEPAKPHQPEQTSLYRSRRQRRRDPNTPRQSDNKCYICKSDSMESPAALLDHFTTHLDRIPHTCTECVMETFVLKSVRSLNIHLKMHAQPVKCEYCDRRYSDESAKNEHVKSLHLGENAPCPSTCEQCGKVCKSIRSLKNHMRDHRLDLRCYKCGKVFHRAFQLREHVLHVHEKAKKFECKLCNHVVHSLESYNSHLKMHTEDKTYVCDLCPMKFYTAGNLRLHQRAHAKNPNYKPKKNWTTHYTVTQDPERGKTYTCNQCGNTYHGSVNNIISHVKLHFKELQCDQCDLKFTNQANLRIHYVAHTRERNYRCQHCGKDYLYRSHMVYHIKHKHPELFVASTRTTGNPRRPRPMPVALAVPSGSGTLNKMQ